MASGVSIVGIGSVGFARETPDLSYKEMMFAAARAAYEDAGVDARSDIDSFVACSEDFLEGTSIFDEYVPDQLGAVQRPVQTVAGDGLFGIATAAMLIRSGVARLVAVEAHSKASNTRTLGSIEAFGMDPVLNRPLGISTLAVAGLEMHRVLEVSGATEEDCADVARANRAAARTNPRAAYPSGDGGDGGDPDATPLYWPLRKLDVAEPADGCVVVVLASADRANDLPGRPIGVLGCGWSSESPTLESRDWARAGSVERAAAIAFGAADVTPSDVDVAEVDDTYSYKQLQHLDALGLSRDGAVVNPSGGALGQGNLFEANGLARVLSCVEQLRGEAGDRQRQDARLALAQSSRSIPSTSAAVAILGPAS